MSFTPIRSVDLEGRRGRLRMSNPAPGVWATHATGHIDSSLVDQFTAFGDQVLTQASETYGLHEWYGLDSYDSQARKQSVAWSARVIREFAGVHIGLRSRIVRMGVTLANVVLDNRLTVHDDPADFHRVVDDIVHGKLAD